MCGLAFELHSIVIHRLYSRPFVLAEGEEKSAIAWKKRDSLHLQRSNLIKSTLTLFTTRKFINFSRFYIYISIRKQLLQRIVRCTLLKRTINT